MFMCSFCDLFFTVANISQAKTCPNISQAKTCPTKNNECEKKNVEEVNLSISVG